MLMTAVMRGEASNSGTCMGNRRSSIRRGSPISNEPGNDAICHFRRVECDQKYYTIGQFRGLAPEFLFTTYKRSDLTDLQSGHV
jgi:hypothetical protein